MMDDAEQEIMTEASPDFVELLNRDHEQQASMRKILHDMEVVKSMDYVMDPTRLMKRLYRLFHQQMGKWQTLMLSIPPNLYDNENFKSTCIEFQDRLFECGFRSDTEPMSESSDEDESISPNDKNLVLEMMQDVCRSINKNSDQMQIDGNDATPKNVPKDKNKNEPASDSNKGKTKINRQNKKPGKESDREEKENNKNKLSKT
ncbi:hypothetical protein HNY73_011147 [Argiope bruennichi]|uniref:Uncharacterized protein n=1 Tax=Argiope bruennichi TaxID=94029 RepID=A0A8T0F5E0_ARGBR|nr:hypothetical protein HNY73_011147 [Argiope bruennichi]